MSVPMFVLGATAAALIGAAALLTLTARGDGLAASWAARGFLAVALPGVAGGAWLAREHGRAGSRFVVALQAGIYFRLVAAGVVAFCAARVGETAVTGLVTGLAAGFVPVTVFQTAWFARSRNAVDVATETRG